MKHSLAAIAMLLLGTSISHADTINLLGSDLTFTGVAPAQGVVGQVNPSFVAGTLQSTTAPSFLNDWVEFDVSPSTTGLVNVDVLNNPINGFPSFTAEVFRITRDTIDGMVVAGAFAANNNVDSVALHSGVNYFFELQASGVNGPIGQSNFQLTTTPLPAAFPLFAGGLGLVGWLARRRKAKASPGCDSLIQTGCAA
jgi:hypothetical protein